MALVSDARALDIAPRIARLFVSARLRHFPADALDEALAWVAVRGDEPPDVTLMEGLPDDTVGISVRGVIDAGDYAEKIVPAIEAELARHEKIKMLYRIGPEFETFTPGALWSDTRLGDGEPHPLQQGGAGHRHPLDARRACGSSPRSCPARSGSSRDRELDGGQGLDAREGRRQAEIGSARHRTETATACAQPRSRISRAFWRCQSRLASVARLSASFLPLAMPSWSLALPRSLK